jgi:hypothetical protein
MVSWRRSPPDGRSKRLLVPIIMVLPMLLMCWFIWHNSSQQKLRRCVKAQSDHFYSTSEGKELHQHGSDPPVTLFVIECNQMGVR